MSNTTVLAATPKYSNSLNAKSQDREKGRTTPTSTMANNTNEEDNSSYQHERGSALLHADLVARPAHVGQAKAHAVTGRDIENFASKLDAFNEGMFKTIQNTRQENEQLPADDRRPKPSMLARLTHGTKAADQLLATMGESWKYLMSHEQDVLKTGTHMLECPDFTFLVTDFGEVTDDIIVKLRETQRDNFQTIMNNLARNVEDGNRRKENDERARHTPTTRQGPTTHLVLSDDTTKDKALTEAFETNWGSHIRMGGAAGLLDFLLRVLRADDMTHSSVRREKLRHYFQNHPLLSSGWLTNILEPLASKFDMPDDKNMMKQIANEMEGAVFGLNGNIVQHEVYDGIAGTWHEKCEARDLQTAVEHIIKEYKLQGKLGIVHDRRAILNRLLKTVTTQVRRIIIKWTVSKTYNDTNPAEIDRDEYGNATNELSGDINEMMAKWRADIAAMCKTAQVSITDNKGTKTDEGDDNGKKIQQKNRPPKDERNISNDKTGNRENEDSNQKKAAAAMAEASSTGKVYCKMGNKDSQKLDLSADTDYEKNPNFKPADEINPQSLFDDNYGRGMKNITKTKEGDVYCSFCGYGDHQCGGCPIMPRIQGKRSQYLNTQWKKKKS